MVVLALGSPGGAPLAAVMHRVGGDGHGGGHGEGWPPHGELAVEGVVGAGAGAALAAGGAWMGGRKRGGGGQRGGWGVVVGLGVVRPGGGWGVPWTMPVLMMEPILEWVWFTMPVLAAGDGGAAVTPPGPRSSPPPDSDFCPPRAWIFLFQTQILPPTTDMDPSIWIPPQTQIPPPWAPQPQIHQPQKPPDLNSSPLNCSSPKFGPTQL